ncbi:Crp/Fnr family transcriptional regulator [Xylophilus sp.]|uniref:Crp/Fnr family transcriptional regulator n=1 Tax=Xylophilus sp. TaxID=2653893 RepID=UPI002D8041E4|nr:Crp/Fnr family transcriptional regulator [Xylophilus sp.]
MLPSTSFVPPPERQTVVPGDPVVERGSQPLFVTYLESGRIALGLGRGAEGGDAGEARLRHRLGTAEGPLWLDSAAAILGLPAFVDAVAETPAVLRRMPLEEFRRAYAALPGPVRVLMHDLAAGQRQQCELAVSRLAQDAEARCAQWLLRHAERLDEGRWRVTLRQRKRMIAAQLGIAPETLSRVLRHLREMGLVAGSGTVLELPHPGALQAVAGR